MLKNKKNFKVAVVEDNEFYNKLMTKHVSNYFYDLGMTTRCHFEVLSYVHADDFLRNISLNFDVALLDYYLQRGTTGMDLARKLKAFNDNCEIGLMSKAEHVKDKLRDKGEQVKIFLSKYDRLALPRACFFIEDVFREKVLNINYR